MKRIAILALLLSSPALAGGRNGHIKRGRQGRVPEVRLRPERKLGRAVDHVGVDRSLRVQP